MKKISIVIPVYNSEKYIKKCLDSIVNQNYENLEVIVVNDGSTDNSEKIIKEYEEKYEYIKYYYKENGGVSDARNLGIRNSSGDYLCFVDPDDYISDNLYSSLQEYIEKDIDIIKFKLSVVDEKYNEIGKVDGPIFDVTTGEEAFNILYGKDVMLQPPVVYLYRSSFWKENNFEYPKGKNHEDFAVTPLVILKAKSMVSLNIVGYYYYQTALSITRGNDEEKRLKRATDMLCHYDNMIKAIDSYEISDNTKENVKIYYTNCIILKIPELCKENQRKYIKEIKNRKMLKNIKVRNAKQLIKKIILNININLYLKLR